MHYAESSNHIINTDTLIKRLADTLIKRLASKLEGKFRNFTKYCSNSSFAKTVSGTYKCKGDLPVLVFQYDGILLEVHY